MPLRNWISRNQAAEILGVNPQTVSNYAEKGLIQCRKHKKYNYCLFWKPEVDALAVNQTFKEAAVLQNRADQIKQQTQELLTTAKAEYARREKEFRDAFGTLFPAGENHYGNLDRYRFLLYALINGANIKKSDKTFLEDVLAGKTPEQICSGMGLTSGYFKTRYRQALKHLLEWYSDKQAEINTLHKTIAEQKADNASLRKEKQLLAECLKDEERATAIKNTSSMESKLELILRTCSPYNIPLINAGLSVRAINCARAADVHTIGELAMLRKTDVFKWRNTGRKSMNEYENLLERWGLTFGHNPITQLNPPAEEESKKKTSTSVNAPPQDHTPVAEGDEPWSWKLSRTGINPRLQRLLNDAGIETLGQLANTTRAELKAIHGLGNSSLKEAIRLLKRFNVEI